MLHLSVLASTPNRNSLQDPYWGNYGARIGQPAQRDLYHFCLGCSARHVPTALSGLPSQMFHISTKSLSIYYGMYVENKLLVCVILDTIRISICLPFFSLTSNFCPFGISVFKFYYLVHLNVCLDHIYRSPLGILGQFVSNLKVSCIIQVYHNIMWKLKCCLGEENKLDKNMKDKIIPIKAKPTEIYITTTWLLLNWLLWQLMPTVYRITHTIVNLYSEVQDICRSPLDVIKLPLIT